MKILPKNKSVRLAKGLTSLEFQCKCSYESCRAVVVSKKLIKAYGTFREMVGVPLTINSGHRCAQHNFDVGGTALSQHQFGMAIDISKKSINHLSDDDITHALKASGFTFVKHYKTFVHADVRELK